MSITDKTQAGLGYLPHIQVLVNKHDILMESKVNSSNSVKVHLHLNTAYIKYPSPPHFVQFNR